MTRTIVSSFREDHPPSLVHSDCAAAVLGRIPLHQGISNVHANNSPPRNTIADPAHRPSFVHTKAPAYPEPSPRPSLAGTGAMGGGGTQLLRRIHDSVAARGVPQGSAPILVETAVGRRGHAAAQQQQQGRWQQEVEEGEDEGRPAGLSDRNYLTPRAYLEPEWLHGILSREEAEAVVQVRVDALFPCTCARV